MCGFMHDPAPLPPTCSSCMDGAVASSTLSHGGVKFLVCWSDKPATVAEHSQQLGIAGGPGGNKYGQASGDWLPVEERWDQTSVSDTLKGRMLNAKREENLPNER